MKKVAWIALALTVLMAPAGFSMMTRGTADTPACCTNHQSCCPGSACCKGGSHTAGMHCAMNS